MKHGKKVTIILIAIFLLTQIFGGFTYLKSIRTSLVDGELVIDHKDTFLGETPELKQEEKKFSFVPIVLIILFGTVLLLLMIKFKLGIIWKIWFFIAVTLTMALTFEVYIQLSIAITLALILGVLKVWKPNIIVHNLTEIFIYTGIVIVIGPLLNLFSAIILLVAISLYDIYAVWHSKHMVKLAKFQTESKVFAGLYVPYSSKGKINVIKSKGDGKVKNAILGGGDIAFPLIFNAAVIEWLMLRGVEEMVSFSLSLIIIATTTIALGLLFLKSEKNKFYPAMPFVSAGCFVGLAIVYFIA